MCKSLRDRGFAVELDRHGRHVFTKHPATERDWMVCLIDPKTVCYAEPARSGGFFITPLGRERAEYAADVAAPRDGVPFDPTLMEDH